MAELNTARQDEPDAADERGVALRCRGEVAWVSLNRPSAANAINPDLVAALTRLLTQAAAARPVVVLTGEGNNFCAGFDLRDQTPRAHRFLRLAELLEHLRALPCVTVAAAHGHAVGAGADLFSHCDIRIAAPGADFRFPGFTKFGVVLGTQRLAELVGSAAAIDAAACGSVWDAERAQRLGLVDYVQPRESWQGWLDELGAALAAVPRASADALVRAVRRRPDAGSEGVAMLARSLSGYAD